MGRSEPICPGWNHSDILPTVVLHWIYLDGDALYPAFKVENLDISVKICVVTSRNDPKTRIPFIESAPVDFNILFFTSIRGDFCIICEAGCYNFCGRGFPPRHQTILAILNNRPIITCSEMVDVTAFVSKP